MAYRQDGIHLGSIVPTIKSESLLDGKIVDLIGNTADKLHYKILFFYTSDWSSVAASEINEISDRYDYFLEHNCVFYGISSDTAHSHLSWSKTSRLDGGIEGIKFPLIGDVTRIVSARFGAIDSTTGLTKHATFILDTTGVVRFMSYTDEKTGRNIEELLRQVKAIREVDKTGFLCPASWYPGDKTLPVPLSKNENGSIYPPPNIS